MYDRTNIKSFRSPKNVINKTISSFFHESGGDQQKVLSSPGNRWTTLFAKHYNPGAPDYNALILFGNQYYNLGVPDYNVLILLGNQNYNLEVPGYNVFFSL